MDLAPLSNDWAVEYIEAKNYEKMQMDEALDDAQLESKGKSNRITFR